MESFKKLMESYRKASLSGDFHQMHTICQEALISLKSGFYKNPCVELDLPGANKIEIRLLRKVTPKEFEAIKAIYEISEVAFVVDPETAIVATPELTEAAR